MLDAGIDVFSTVNVQHLESLNDQVAELTGVRVRETMPDSVLGAADEVVLIDLTPEALLERLRAGKIYPGERIEAGAPELLPDREPRRAARGRAAPGRPGGRVQAAGARERVGTREDRVLDTAAPQAVGERLLALVKPRPAWPADRPPGLALGAAAGRRARPALGAAARARARRARPSAQLDAMRRLASVLGAHLIVEEGDDVVDVAKRVAAERGTTYVLIGTAAAAAASGAARASRCRCAWSRRCRGSTCGSSPTGRCAIAVKRGERRMSGRAARSRSGRDRRRRRRHLSRRRGSAPRAPGEPHPLPIPRHELSRPALDAALRLARAEDATLVPAYLAQVPMTLPLDSAAAQAVRATPCRSWRRSSSARPAAASPSTRGSSAGAPTATPSRADRPRALRPDRRPGRRTAGRRLQPRRRRLAARPRQGRDRHLQAGPSRRGLIGRERHTAELTGAWLRPL